ncbi:hypothetical protein [Pueribacillus theae]|nr:hypothetical protein [Pueribacillus theae]
MDKKFLVEADEVFFNAFKNVQLKVQHLGSMFQNEGTITTEEEMNQWKH